MVWDTLQSENTNIGWQRQSIILFSEKYHYYTVFHIIIAQWFVIKKKNETAWESAQYSSIVDANFDDNPKIISWFHNSLKFKEHPEVLELIS